MDPFATLGLPRRFDLDRDQLEQQYRQLQRALHPDRHAGAPASQRRLTLSKAMEVNEAYRKLKDELSRAETLLSLSGAADATDAAAADPEFLMEMMELRERLGDAKSAGDLERVRALADTVQGMRDASRAALVEAFAGDTEAATGADTEAADWPAIQEHIGRLKYHARFLDEVAVIEDEHL